MQEDGSKKIEVRSQKIEVRSKRIEVRVDTRRLK